MYRPRPVNHYIWGDPLPDFTAPELPKKGTKDEKKTTQD